MSDPASVEAVTFEAVTLAPGGRRVLSDVSLSIRRGEFVGVLGPNGAGKTTMMRAILGLQPVRSGRLRVLGAAARRGHRGVGYMPQGRTAMPGPRLCGRAAVAAAAGGHRWGRFWLGAQARQEVDRALSLVSAQSLAERPLGELSGGERQRLLLAQALLGRPDLLLLDEPLSALDPRHGRDVVSLVRDLQRELGLAVLFSAHELNPLLGAMDRVLFLGGGRAAIGTVDEVVQPDVLSRLYGAPMEVLRSGGRCFVVSGEHDLGHAHACQPCLGSAPAACEGGIVPERGP